MKYTVDWEKGVITFDEGEDTKCYCRFPEYVCERCEILGDIARVIRKNKEHKVKAMNDPIFGFLFDDNFFQRVANNNEAKLNARICPNCSEILFPFFTGWVTKWSCHKCNKEYEFLDVPK